MSESGAGWGIRLEANDLYSVHTSGTVQFFVRNADNEFTRIAVLEDDDRPLDKERELLGLLTARTILSRRRNISSSPPVFSKVAKRV